MSLADELEALKRAWSERVGPEVAGLVEENNNALRASGIQDRALKAGERFPTLVLPDQLNRPIDLAKLMAKGPLVVTFYRGGWCPFCCLELRAYQAALAEITALGARLVAVSPETPDNALTTMEKNELRFTVLSDVGGRLADALGIGFELTPAIRARYQAGGYDLPARNGDGRWSLPVPATYVIGRGGRIRFAAIDPDYRARLEPTLAINALRDLAEIAAERAGDTQPI